jgi:hypothetical protein
MHGLGVGDREDLTPAGGVRDARPRTELVDVDAAVPSRVVHVQEPAALEVRGERGGEHAGLALSEHVPADVQQRLGGLLRALAPRDDPPAALDDVERLVLALGLGEEDGLVELADLLQAQPAGARFIGVPGGARSSAPGHGERPEQRGGGERSAKPLGTRRVGGSPHRPSAGYPSRPGATAQRHAP